MARLILLALLVAGVYAVVKRVLHRRDALNERRRPAFEATVRCRRCGAYVARRHAQADDDGFVCRAHETS